MLVYYYFVTKQLKFYARLFIFLYSLLEKETQYWISLIKHMYAHF